MSTVAPSITAYTKEEYDAALGRMAAISQRLHIDLMDGQFSPTTSVAPNQLSWPEDKQVDIHLMYAQPETQLKIIQKLKPSLVIIHAEAQGNLLGFMKSMQEAGIKAGLALLRTTVPTDHVELIEAADHVLIFSGHLGKQGGVANFLQIEKVPLVRKINPSAEIGWDGGASVDNAYTLALGGIDVLNVGKTLSSADDPHEIYRQLDFEVHRKDVLKNQKNRQ